MKTRFSPSVAKIISLAALAFLGTAAALPAADFRNLSWGMSRAEVKKHETAKLEDNKATEMVFSCNMNGQPVVLRYYFKADKLTHAEYTFAKQYRESEKYIQAYDDLQNQLVQKYGAPACQAQRCSDSFYADFPKRWGTGVVVGKLTREALWRDEARVVRHSLRALPGGAVGHVLSYEPAQKSVSEFSTILSAL